MKTIKSLFIVFSMLMGASSAFAAELGNGATSLSETYDDWVVSCAKDKDQKNQCNLSQRGIQQETNKQVLLITLQPNGTGLLGDLVLPFGISLSEGVKLQLNEDKSLPSLAFSTCLPFGCIAPINFDASTIKELSAAEQLNVIITINDSKAETKLTVSLKGFAKAVARTAALSKN